MSDAAIDRLINAEQVLRGAMQDGETRAIEDALAAFMAALEAVRGLGAWHADPALKQKLQDLRAHMVSDQKLARLLADLSQQKLDLLAGTTPQAIAPTTYTRRG